MSKLVCVCVCGFIGLLQKKQQTDIPCRGLEHRCRKCLAHMVCHQWRGPSADSTPSSQQPGRRAYSDPSLVLNGEGKEIMEKKLDCSSLS